MRAFEASYGGDERLETSKDETTKIPLATQKST
jgi:hypothetical protein